MATKKGYKKPSGFTTVQSWQRDLEDEIVNYQRILKSGNAMGRKLTAADRVFFEGQIKANQASIDAIKQGEEQGT